MLGKLLHKQLVACTHSTHAVCAVLPELQMRKLAAPHPPELRERNLIPCGHHLLPQISETSWRQISDFQISTIQVDLDRTTVLPSLLLLGDYWGSIGIKSLGILVLKRHFCNDVWNFVCRVIPHIWQSLSLAVINPFDESEDKGPCLVPMFIQASFAFPQVPHVHWRSHTTSFSSVFQPIKTTRTWSDDKWE